MVLHWGWPTMRGLHLECMYPSWGDTGYIPASEVLHLRLLWWTMEMGMATGLASCYGDVHKVRLVDDAWCF